MTTQLFLNKALEVYERFGTYASNTLVPKLAEVATDILGHSMWVDAAPGLHKARIALVLPSGERLRPITVYTTLHTLAVLALHRFNLLEGLTDNDSNCVTITIELTHFPEQYAHHQSILKYALMVEQFRDFLLLNGRRIRLFSFEQFNNILPLSLFELVKQLQIKRDVLAFATHVTRNMDMYLAMTRDAVDQFPLLVDHTFYKNINHSARNEVIDTITRFVQNEFAALEYSWIHTKQGVSFNKPYIRFMPYTLSTIGYDLTNYTAEYRSTPIRLTIQLPAKRYSVRTSYSVESLLSPEYVRLVSDNSVVQQVLRKTAIPGELLNRVSATFHASNECAAAYICDTARETSIDDIRNMRTGGVVVPPVVVQLLTYWRLNGDVGYVSHH